MQLLQDHCFPFGYSTFLWVSSPCGVVHWNSITAQTSASNQHHFPTCTPPVSLPLLGECFFPPVTTFFKSSSESFYSSWKVIARYPEKSIPKEQCRDGHSSGNFKGKTEQGPCERSSWRQMCKKQLSRVPLTPSNSHSFLAYRPKPLPPLPLGSSAHSQELGRLFFHTLTQKKWSPAANAGFFS